MNQLQIYSSYDLSPQGWITMSSKKTIHFINIFDMAFDA